MILHITNDYSGSMVYKNLVSALDGFGISQCVYTPVKTELSVDKNNIDMKTQGSSIVYSKILNKTIDRIFYKRKIKKICKDIETKIDLSKVSFIHAHTWYSDGGVAYMLSEKYDIPYIVTIRNSDMNVFQKYLIHERAFGRQILEKAKSIILISASYKDRVLSESSLRKIYAQLETKLRVVTNGVDPYWIVNVVAKQMRPKNNFKFLYVGKFSSGKNVLKLLNAVKNLNKNTQRGILELVGGGGADELKVLREVENYPDVFKYHGKVDDKERLKEIYQSCDIFAMPSRNETFGLVYVEAMLQGLPILYTANEGIDGFYQEKIGEKVSKKADVLEIQNALLTMIENYASYEIPTAKLLENHNWKRIALTYQKLYQQ